LLVQALEISGQNMLMPLFECINQVTIPPTNDFEAAQNRYAPSLDMPEPANPALL
jgi:hypothetical protein